jgi:uncharacterized membrane protein YdbT with pleckstrin-like domain
MADETKRCPYCGEEILLIAKKCKHCGEFLNNTVSPPQHSTAYVNLPEKTLWQGSPSHYYYLGAYIIVGGLLIFAHGYRLGIIIILWALLDKKSKIFTITNKRTKSKKGILARTTREVALKDIRSINLKQSIIERLCNLGTIEIGSAGTAGIEVSFNGISQAPKIKNMITELKDQLS